MCTETPCGQPKHPGDELGHWTRVSPGSQVLPDGVFVQPCVLSIDLPGKDTLKLYLALRTLQTETVYQAQAAV